MMITKMLQGTSKILEVTIQIQKFQNLKNNYNSYVIFLQKICLKLLCQIHQELTVKKK